jgi:hypothetical protein
MAAQGNTTARLRADIDRGRTGSKIDYPDPAAAPLGTDDEAAGTPASAAAVSAARRQEVDEGVQTASKRKGLGAGAAVFAAVLAAIIAALAALAVWLAN